MVVVVCINRFVYLFWLETLRLPISQTDCCMISIAVQCFNLLNQQQFVWIRFSLHHICHRNGFTVVAEKRARERNNLIALGYNSKECLSVFMYFWNDIKQFCICKLNRRRCSCSWYGLCVPLDTIARDIKVLRNSAHTEEVITQNALHWMRHNKPKAEIWAPRAKRSKQISGTMYFCCLH